MWACCIDTMVQNCIHETRVRELRYIIRLAVMVKASKVQFVLYVSGQSERNMPKLDNYTIFYPRRFVQGTLDRSILRYAS